jgi:N-acetylglucosaminyldiphosphoundecaprenol N-acetyl-beta-D-mannosaminyltransferase
MDTDRKVDKGLSMPYNLAGQIRQDGTGKNEVKGVRRVNVLGVGISAIDPPTTVQTMADWIEARDRRYVCVCAVHVVMECERDPALRAMVNHSALAVPDGMPLAWIARLSGQPLTRRVYGPDLMLAFCGLAAQRGYRNFLLGGAPGQPEILADRLVARFPGLSIAGTLATPERPLTPEANACAVDAINRAGADVVWVGMGAPLQERWMAENRANLEAPVLVGVGAAFDIHSGWARQAPHWMQRAGLEWSFRLTQEPGRLWRRYLIGNPLFMWKLLGQRLGLRTYDLAGSDSGPDSGAGQREEGTVRR